MPGTRSAPVGCLAHELGLRRSSFERQIQLPVTYKSIQLDCGYRLDLPVHEAQVITYLKLTGLPTGLLVNFHAGDAAARSATPNSTPQKPSRLPAFL